MGCTHVSGCPLFPKLNASLRGWRDAYCDSSTGWHGCARYRQSQTGRTVPLTLLPNGKYAQTIVRAAAANDDDAPPSRFRQVPVPGRRMHGEAAFEALPPAPAPRASAPSTPLSVPPAPRRSWWAHLITWMRGPV